MKKELITIGAFALALFVLTRLLGAGAGLVRGAQQAAVIPEDYNVD